MQKKATQRLLVINLGGWAINNRPLLYNNNITVIIISVQ